MNKKTNNINKCKNNNNVIASRKQRVCQCAEMGPERSVHVHPANTPSHVILNVHTH